MELIESTIRMGADKGLGPTTDLCGDDDELDVSCTIHLNRLQRKVRLRNESLRINKFHGAEYFLRS
jgi:hypothetical protein